MRKKKHKLAALLAAALLLLSGCHTQELPGNTAQPTEASTVSAEESTACEPLSPGKLTPSRELYISCQDMQLDLDIYGWFSVDFGFRFHILSTEAVDADSLLVTVPVEAPYSVQITALEVSPKTEHMALQEGLLEKGEASREYFPYWLYMAYRGKDFEKLNALYQQHQDDYAYGHFLYEELNDYKALTEEDIPTFYAYEVKVEFRELEKAESFRTLEVTLAGDTHAFDIGEVRLVPEQDIFTLPVSSKLQNLASQYLGGMFLPCSREAQPAEPHFWFTAEEDMTVTGLSFPEGKAQASEIQVRINRTDTASREFSWDGSTPFPVSAGDTVSVLYALTLEKEIPFPDHTEVLLAQLSFQSQQETACLYRHYALFD